MFSLTPYTRRGNVSAYNPFRELDELERAFFGGTQLAEFRTDIRDAGEAYELEADLPGFKKEDIAIDVKADTLTVSAKRSFEREEKDGKRAYVCRERSCGSYARSFDISGIDAERISAEYSDGVLRLTLPKKKETVPEARRIELK